MPQVPYQPYPDVEPTEKATRGISVNTPGAAFGENVAGAIGNLGKTIEGAGNELFNRALALQELQNETEAREADANYMTQSGILHEQFSQLEGKNKVDALPGHIQQLNQLRQDIRNSLKTDMSKKFYDASSLGFMGRNIFNAAGQAGSANKEYVKGTLKAQEDAVYDEVAHNPDSDAAIKAGAEKLHGIAQTEAGMHGQSPEAAKDNYDKKVSAMTMSRIVSLARSGKPFQANDLLESQGELLKGKDFENTQSLVYSHMRSMGSQIIAEEVVGQPVDGKWEKSANDMVAEGVAKGEKMLGHEDPLMRESVTNAVNNRRAQLMKGIRDFKYQNKEIINGAINQFHPTSPEELRRVSPEAGNAYDHSSETEKKSWNAAFNHNATMGERDRRIFEDSDEGRLKYQGLVGLAKNDPEAFMNHNFAADKFSTPTTHRLQDMQKRMASGGMATDPRLDRAMKILRESRGPDMEALKVYRRAGSDDEKLGFDQFTGALQDELDTWRAEHKDKPPSKDDILEMGQRLLYRKSGWFSYYDPIFKESPSGEDKEFIKKELTKELGMEPTDNQINREHVRRLLEKLHKSKTSKPDESKPPDMVDDF